MHSLRQTFRQPTKAFAGILLVAMAVMILVLCVGQTMAAGQIGKSAEELFTTIALPTGHYLQNEHGDYTANIPEDALRTLEQLCAEQKDAIKTRHAIGLASAYIPDLTLDNATEHPSTTSGGYYATKYWYPNPVMSPYACAMLEITLTDVYDPFEIDDCTAIVRGSIDRVISLQSGFHDPVGLDARIKLTLPVGMDVSSLGLEIGQKYLVYSPDYYDSDWVDRCIACMAEEYGEITIDAFDPEKLRYYPEDEVEMQKAEHPNYYHIAFYQGSGLRIPMDFTEETLDTFRTVALTMNLSVADTYTIPTFARLETDAETFLSSPEGKAWQDTLAEMEINTHAFPILGVTNLNAVAAFNRSIAYIDAGRDFTREEQETGANVCILSETVAQKSGLTVGDTITLRYYDPDPENPYQTQVGNQNPTAAMYFGGTTPFVDSAQEYTIVGLYQLENAWANPWHDIYSITPNAVFVPQASVKSQLTNSTELLLGTIQLQNGSMKGFSDAVMDTKFPHLFEYYDQGFSIVQENLQNYDTIARQALVTGVSVYGVILLLFLALFPMQQKRTLAMMGSMGAYPGEKMLHVLLSSLGILLPGTILGAGAGIVLWQRVVTTLTAAAATDLQLQLSVPKTLLLAAVQLALALALSCLLTLPATCGSRLMRKR